MVKKKTREALLVATGRLRPQVEAELAKSDAMDVPLGLCFVCRKPVNQNALWLLHSGGLESHVECEEAAYKIRPAPVVGGITVKAMRMHPPKFSTVEIPPRETSDTALFRKHTKR